MRSGQFSATINYVMTILRLALGFGVAVGRRWWRTGVERENRDRDREKDKKTDAEINKDRWIETDREECERRTNRQMQREGD